MRLKTDALPVFEHDHSPIAVHARRRWLDGSSGAAALAAETARRLEEAQSADGSWDGAVAPTIQNLFALWLLVERPDRAIDRALDWLLETGRQPMKHRYDDGATYDGMFFRTTRRDHQELRRLAGVPFTPGCSGFVKTGAALFFGTQFGRADDDRVRKAYASLNRTAQVRHGRLCSGSCANNMHLALAVHPRQRRGAGMAQVLGYLARHQQPSGSWARGIPFFPTLWALSHLNSRGANAQFQQALLRVQRSQNRDGSWGRRQKMLDTFLVLDALARKGIEIEAD